MPGDRLISVPSPPTDPCAHGLNGQVQKRFGLVRHQQFGIKRRSFAQPVASRTHSAGRIEAEHLRRGRLERKVALQASALRRQQNILVLGRHDECALTELQSRRDCLGEPISSFAADGQSVDDDLDVVFAVALECGIVRELHDLPVDASANVAGFEHVLEQVAVLALLASDDRGEHQHLRVGSQGEDLSNDLLARLGGDRLAALRAVLGADAGEQHAQVVMNLRDGSHRAARIPTAGLLLDRDGWRQAGDRVDVRLLQLPEELPRVSAERFNIAPLAFGIERVEGERTLAAAGHAGEANQAIARQRDADVAQIMLARPTNNDVLNFSFH